MGKGQRGLAWSVFAGVVGCSIAVFCARESQRTPTAKAVKIDRVATADMRILGGPPETVTMWSGSVVLPPGKSVGKHNTGTYEEAVVVLAGAGEMRLVNGTVLKLGPDVVAYCPPATEHDVINTGKEPLRYVYVAAKAGEASVR